MKLRIALMVMALVITLPCFTAQLSADILISMTQEETAAGSQVKLVASISDPDGGSSFLNNYNLPLDFVDLNDDFGIPSGLTFVSASSLTGELSNFAASATVGSPFNYDLVASDSGSPGLALNSSGTDLFSLIFEVDPSVAAGTVFDISLQLAPTPNPAAIQLTVDGNSTNTVDLVSNGKITVIQIPEPSSAILLAASLAGVAVRRKSRKG